MHHSGSYTDFLETAVHARTSVTFAFPVHWLVAQSRPLTDSRTSQRTPYSVCHKQTSFLEYEMLSNPLGRGPSLPRALPRSET